MKTKRVYPKLSDSGSEPSRPVSFVVVRFSDEYLHNFLPSHCSENPLNEVIEVDNTSNLYFDNLSRAMSYGVKEARHDLIAVVHEDVHLVRGWQKQFEQSLAKLEEQDDKWGVIGSVGWSCNGTVHGHWSDPYGYYNTFKKTGELYHEVERLDEQILIFHRSRLPGFDVNLPGIHHIGRDLSLGMRKHTYKTYALDAPTIHKYRDKDGQLVLNHQSSEKIRDRKSLTYLADKACCDNYIDNKWPELTGVYDETDVFDIPFSEAGKLSQLKKPVILLSRGGSGSRLLSYMVNDAGVFLGNELNASGDSIELVIPFYRAIIEKYRCSSGWQRKQRVSRIKAAAARMIKNLPEDRVWGFKIPESIFLLPELASAFPGASYLHLVRDPETTCLRRTHMTARLDNHIGRITLAEAYDYFGIQRCKILDHNPAEHMAYTTLHQLELIDKAVQKTPKHRFLEIRFENIMTDPEDEMTRLCDWLKVRPMPFRSKDSIDIDRANNPQTTYPKFVVAKVKSILADLRHRLNYADIA